MTTTTTGARLDMMAVAPAVYEHMRGFNALIKQSGVDPKLAELIKVRASQINGCAFCLDMHYALALKLGVLESQLRLLPVWHETTLFSEQERAALELTEAVTRIAERGVSDELYEKVRAQFSSEHIVGLLTAIWSTGTFEALY